MIFTYLAQKESGEDIPDLIEDIVESLHPTLEESRVLLKFFPESKSSIRLIKLFLSCLKLGLFLLIVLDKYSLSCYEPFVLLMN